MASATAQAGGGWADSAFTPSRRRATRAVGPAADVFAPGRIIYHMLRGKLPYPYQPLDKLPAKFRDLVDCATAELRDDRYPSVAAFSAALTEVGIRRAG